MFRSASVAVLVAFPRIVSAGEIDLRAPADTHLSPWVVGHAALGAPFNAYEFVPAPSPDTPSEHRQATPGQGNAPEEARARADQIDVPPETKSRRAAHSPPA
jgi:hypothetical protein